METTLGESGAVEVRDQIDAGRIDGEAKRDPSELGAAVYAAAALSLGAALVHLWVMPAHLLEWWGYGAFFLGCATSQGLFGVLILRYPASQLISLIGVWGNTAIATIYVMTRTYGIPVGPHVGHAEEPDLLGVVATAAELGLVVCLVALQGGAQRRWTVNALLLLGATIWALRFVGILP